LKGRFSQARPTENIAETLGDSTLFLARRLSSSTQSRKAAMSERLASLRPSRSLHLCVEKVFSLLPNYNIGCGWAALG
jgi:hypothetical protein